MDNLSMDDFIDIFDENFDTLPGVISPVEMLKNAGLQGDVKKYTNTLTALEKGREGGSYNVENVMIHDQALETAVSILNNHISSHTSQFLVFSGTQAGKTNLMTTYSLLHNDFISMKENCLSSNNKTVVYVFGPPPRDLQGQTIKRFIKSNLYRQIINDKLNKTRYITPLKLTPKGEREFASILEKDRKDGYSIVFFFDEAHEGSGLNTKKDIEAMQKMQTFCKEYSVPLMGQKVPEDRELLEVGIHITATPAHLLQEYRANPGRFVISVLKPGKNYFGVLDHDSEDRIYDVKNVPSLSDLCGNDSGLKKVAEKFFFNLLAEYVVHNVKNNDSGHLVFRYTSSSSKCHPKDLFKKWLGQKLEDKVDFREFSSHNQNMELMNDYISAKPPIGTTSIVFVKQGLGRGITLDSKENIQLCFENRSNDASTLQSFIGRLTGYGLKFHDKLKIYTDCSVIESQRRWLEMFTSSTHDLNLAELNERMESLAQDPMFIQSGTHLKKSCVESYEADMSKDNVFNTRSEAEAFIRSQYPDYLKKGAKLSCSTCSGVNSKDVAKIISEGTSSARLSGSKDVVDMNCGYRIILIHVDGMNENFKKSWEKLSNSFKSHYVGKYLVRYAKQISVTNISKKTSNWG